MASQLTSPAMRASLMIDPSRLYDCMVFGMMSRDTNW